MAAAAAEAPVDDTRVFVRAYPQARAKCAPALAAAYIRALLDEVGAGGGWFVAWSAQSPEHSRLQVIEKPLAWCAGGSVPCLPAEGFEQCCSARFIGMAVAAFLLPCAG